LRFAEGLFSKRPVSGLQGKGTTSSKDDVDLMRTGDFMRFGISRAIFLLALTPAMAQQRAGLLATTAAPQGEVAAMAIPDAPLPSSANTEGQSLSPAASPSSSATANPGEGQQTKRILWIIPNFRAVSAGVKLPPQSVKEKFKTGALDSFDYSSFIFVGIQAGISQGSNAYPAFRQGAAGYGRYYWHTFADQTDENLWVLGAFCPLFCVKTAATTHWATAATSSVDFTP
jgi:hypothetical protein